VAYSQLTPAGGQLFKVSSSGGQKPLELVRSGVVSNAWAACSWSPDGESIAYRAADGVRVVASRGGDSRLIAAGRGAPQFMPDGRLFAFVLDGEPPTASLATFDPVSGKRLSTARLALPASYPASVVQALAVHPGGKRITITAGKSNSDIFVIEKFAEPATGWRRLFHHWAAMVERLIGTTPQRPETFPRIAERTAAPATPGRRRTELQAAGLAGVVARPRNASPTGRPLSGSNRRPQTSVARHRVGDLSTGRGPPRENGSGQNPTTV
jgi:hypothetical protein